MHLQTRLDKNLLDECIDTVSSKHLQQPPGAGGDSELDDTKKNICSLESHLLVFITELPDFEEPLVSHFFGDWDTFQKSVLEKLGAERHLELRLHKAMKENDVVEIRTGGFDVTQQAEFFTKTHDFLGLYGIVPFDPSSTSRHYLILEALRCQIQHRVRDMSHLLNCLLAEINDCSFSDLVSRVLLILCRSDWYNEALKVTHEIPDDKRRPGLFQTRKNYSYLDLVSLLADSSSVSTPKLLELRHKIHSLVYDRLCLVVVERCIKKKEYLTAIEVSDSMFFYSALGLRRIFDYLILVSGPVEVSWRVLKSLEKSNPVEGYVSFLKKFIVEYFESEDDVQNFVEKFDLFHRFELINNICRELEIDNLLQEDQKDFPFRILQERERITSEAISETEAKPRPTGCCNLLSEKCRQLRNTTQTSGAEACSTRKRHTCLLNVLRRFSKHLNLEINDITTYFNLSEKNPFKYVPAYF